MLKLSTFAELRGGREHLVLLPVIEVIAHVSRGSSALRSAARIAIPVKLPAIGLAAVPHHICRMVMFGSQ